MPSNVLQGQTVAGTKPKPTAFETYQTTLKSLKPQPSRLSSFYGLSGKTTGNIQQQQQNVQKKTQEQQDVYKNENIKKMMDDLKTKYGEQLKGVGDKLTQGIKTAGTISFPGSPSDETIKALNDGTYKADTTASIGDLNANIDLITKDLSDGKVDDPKVRELFAGQLTGDIEKQAGALLQEMYKDVTGTAAPVSAVPPDVNAIDTSGDWASSYTAAANARNKQLEDLRAQALADLLGINLNVQEDVTPRDTWEEQTRGPSDYENLAFEQAKMLESPNATPESVYGALGLSQTGNAYFDALNREASRREALNAMQGAKGTAADRSGALQGFTGAKEQFGKAMQDIESRWDTQAAATKGELDNLRNAVKTSISTKDIGIKTDEQIKAKAKELADAEAKANGIKITNAKNSDYMKLLAKNKALYEKQIADEAKAQKRAEASDNLQKQGYKKEDADAVVAAAEQANVTPEQLVQTLESLTEEQLNKYISAYGSNLDTVKVVSGILSAGSLHPMLAPLTGPASLGGFLTSLVLKGKQNKYQKQLDFLKAQNAAIDFRDSPENIKKHEGIKKELDTDQSNYVSRGGTKREQETIRNPGAQYGFGEGDR